MVTDNFPIILPEIGQMPVEAAYRLFPVYLPGIQAFYALFSESRYPYGSDAEIAHGVAEKTHYVRAEESPCRMAAFVKALKSVYGHRNSSFKPVKVLKQQDLPYLDFLDAYPYRIAERAGVFP